VRWYEECLSAKPGDPEAVQSHQRVLIEYNRERATQYYKDGQTAQKRGMIFDARNDYEMATKLAPNNGEYSKALSKAALEAARVSSEKDVAEAIRQTSDLISKNNSKGAERVISQALQRHPHNAALELIQGSFGGEETTAAEEKTAPEVKRAKENAKRMTAEADLYLAHGQADLAKENLEKALKANPQNTQIKIKLIRMAMPTPTVSPENQQLAQELYNKGLESYLAGKLEEAIKNWEEALKADPSNTRVQNNLIRAKIEEKMEHP
jgi:tetratricopeptide (TPR) repeat protein